MVRRVYVEKKPAYAQEAKALLDEARSFLGVGTLSSVRIINRYDVEGLDDALFEKSCGTVFSEPQLDDVFFTLETPEGSEIFAVEFLPGQFDQRSDSAAQCIALLSQGERPVVRTAKVYVLGGKLSKEELTRIKNFCINPVESRQALLETFETLSTDFDAPPPVETLLGFCDLSEAGLNAFLADRALAMDLGDLLFCQDYFKREGRDPTITEIKVLDTYWSDHCRHTTFNTIIDGVSFADSLHQAAWDEYLATRKTLGRTKPITLMDIATIAAKRLKAEGKLCKLDESEEINACTVNIELDTPEGKQPWLLLFKNETHNHPTEIEPFGGAATCIGGAVRDPLSGRGYVYAAMRVTGCADPLTPAEETLPGKLPQKKIARTAAAGYSSYGNQLGLATGIVDELYHPGYAAKHLEVGAVIAAVAREDVRREVPADGDKVILLGGRTGRDGIGGATGSSKAHNLSSLTVSGAEVQKGNAPEERKLQRLFRRSDALRLIKRCNDFGAGGVAVAIGEIADGIDITLDAVPKKYAGLDGTELAISESQERMAVVVESDYVNQFLDIAAQENLEATVVATVTKEPRLVMRWNGQTVADISREFLDTNGAPRHISIAPTAAEDFSRAVPTDFEEGIKNLLGDLNVCSKRGLSERFDSTIGAGTVLMPFGGKRQLTPIQAMVHKISLEHGDTQDCSFMSFGYNPYISRSDPYAGAYLAVVESCAKLVASGASFEDVYLSFQEYFEKPLKDPARWGKPLSALLGAFRAQLGLGVAAIGGKDSMSGSFEALDVPPTLISFAVTTGKISDVVSPEFKSAGSRVYLLSPECDDSGLPEEASLLSTFETVTQLIRSGAAISVWTPTYGGAAEGIFKMCLGNGLGFEADGGVSLDELFSYNYGSFILEITDGSAVGKLLGRTTDKHALVFGGQSLSMEELERIYEGKLEPVYHCNVVGDEAPIFVPKMFKTPEILKSRAVGFGKPKALIPVFPGTNCEYDTAKALERAGIEAECFVIRNLTAGAVAESVEIFAKKISSSQLIVLPGGFSGGDEPDGSAKLITAFFRSAALREATMELLEKREGLMLGICNGFQALIKLGLVPYGRITEPEEASPTLSFNTIARHQSKLVRTKLISCASPWLLKAELGEIYTVAISHGEGRFLADESLARGLFENGQVATQYVDDEGKVSGDIQFNPNGSIFGIEGLLSPDGRVFGKMGHSERVGAGLYKNVPGRFELPLFESAKFYFD
ncbi:MAG: phosphoribosylformylglycinamidine synthase [Oscillospiraceae bacterium]|jgi:phosphoribosylformylglycinamidine synthase|nr:phosphoribosylformylglycinamidine synthase [Oscillospiraceae bacterium]